MEHDATDILGQDTMPSVSRAQNPLFSLSLGQFIGISAIFFAVYVFGLRLWRRVLLWRERSYKLATRRRHGIPDNDMRPFNVAYAEAAMRAREDGDRQARPDPTQTAHPSVVDLREASYERNLRNRSIPQRPEARMRSTLLPPGGYNATPAGPYSSSYAPNGVGDTNLYPSLPSESNSQFAQASSPLSRQQGFYNANGSSNGIEDKKRPLDDSMDEEHDTKKSRVDEDAIMGSDVDADEDFHKRGSKRGLQDDVDDHSSPKKNRGKRARNGERTDISMDVDSEEADEVTELRSISRGKKRDRAEAGSTFGGDDYESMDEANGDSKPRRHRKRRTVAKRKSETSYQRGKKRDRGSDDEELSDGSHSSSPGRKLARMKRGKRTSNGSRYDHSVKDDVSMDGSTASRDKVRSVGDEWESGGIRYKIGPNYQRLRQALVKKARQKFLMPKDSQHPDRQEHLQVYVESWLTEEEYKDAKDRHLLAWQDDSPARSEHKDNLTIDITQANFNVPGKSLLWGSSATTTPTLSPAPPSPTSDAGTLDSVKHRGGSRHTLAATTGLPAISHIPTAKRIASASQVLLSSSTASQPLNGSVTASPGHGLSDSANAGSPRTPVKVFSKWEKQELEARAMLKIREANRRKEMEREAKLRAEREAAEQAEKEKERQRQEKERVEREQREASERARKEAQEKAEVEKKAKEAADAAQRNSSVPNITVTVPSTGLGSQPSQSGTPASAIPPGTTGATLFAMPSNPSAMPSPFVAPKAAVTTPSNPFAPSVPGAAKTDTKPTAPSGFSFAAPSTAAANMTTPARGADTGYKTESQAAASGNPLFARLGMPAAPAATSESAKPTSNPLFSFSNSKPSTFSAPVSSTQPTAAASADSTATTTPKFNFGFGAKSTAPATGSSNTTSAPKTDTRTAPALAGAFGSNTSSGTPGASPSPFSFKVPEAPSSATNGGSSTTTNSGFMFGNGPSTFGTTSAFPNSTPVSGQTNTAAKSAFGTTGPFGSGAEPKPSPFGATAAQTQNAFSGGAATSKPGEIKQESKPLFSFANPGTSTASSTSSPFSTTNSSNTAAKPVFSFGTTPSAAASNPPASTVTMSANGAPAAPKFSFNFGATAAPSTTSSAASPFSTAPPSGQNAFGGGLFGASATNQAQAQK